MSIESELQRIVEAKQAMIQAIIDKGVTVPEDTKLEDLPALINQIEGDTPTPVGLPANTLRFRFSDPEYVPYGNLWTKVEGEEDNIWDWTCNSSDWSQAFYYMFDWEFHGEAEVIDAGDTSEVTNMSQMFLGCYNLVSVCLFDTSNVTDMSEMFNMVDWGALEALPLFDTSSVVNADYAFCCCRCVEHGALALYQQMSTQTNPPTSHIGTFADCGDNNGHNPSGEAELAQIPSDWKSYE
jgi:hypothetical protein